GGAVDEAPTRAQLRQSRVPHRFRPRAFEAQERSSDGCRVLRHVPESLRGEGSTARLRLTRHLAPTPVDSPCRSSPRAFAPQSGLLLPPPSASRAAPPPRRPLPRAGPIR